MANVISSLLVRLGVDAEDVQRGMDRAADIVESSGPALAAAGTAAAGVAAAGFAKGFTDSLSMEASTDKMAAQLGLTETESARIGDVAGGLFADAYGESMAETSQAVTSVIANMEGMRGASDSALTDISAKVIDVARAFDEDFNAVTKAAGQLVRNGLAPDVDAAMDIITAGFQAGGDKADDLLDTLNEYSTKFRDLGLEGPQAMGLISQGLAAGARDADIVADSLKEFSIRAIDGSESTAAGFDAIGLSAKDMADKIAAGGPTAATALDTTLDRLRAMEDPVARDAAAVALFGTQAEDLGDALYSLDPSAAVDALGQVEGATESMGTTLNDNATTKINEVSNSFTLWLAELVNAPGLIGDTTAAVAGVGAAAGPAAGNIAMVATAFGGFSGIGKGIGSAAKALWAFTAATSAAALAGARNLAVLIAQRAAMLAGAIVTGVVTAAQWLWNIAVSANPIALIVLAIIALIAIIWLLVSNWDTVLAWLEEAWLWIEETAVAIWGGIKEFFAWLWQSILDILQGAVDGIVWLFENFTPLGLIISNWDAIWGYIEGLWNDIVDFIDGAISEIGDFFSGMWDGISDGLASALNAAISLINSAIDGINILIRGANQVPGISIPTIPRIPYLEEGGIVTGPTLAMIGEGANPEAVIPLPRGMRAGLGGGGPVELTIKSGGTRLDDLLVELLSKAVRVRGGDVQVVLGGRG